jgi:hypothetical protein
MINSLGIESAVHGFGLEPVAPQSENKTNEQILETDWYVRPLKLRKFTNTKFIKKIADQSVGPYGICTVVLHWDRIHKYHTF